MSSFALVIISIGIIIRTSYSINNIQCDGNTTICHNSTIYCPITDTKNCSITCIGPYSCSNSIVMAKSIEELNLKCIQQNACDSITVYGPNVTNSYFKLVSDSYEAAKDAIINVDDTQNLRFECVGSYSCVGMKIYAQNSDAFDGYFTRQDAFRDGQLYTSNISTIKHIQNIPFIEL